MSEWKPIGQVAKDLGVSNWQLKTWSERGLIPFEVRDGVKHFPLSEYPRIRQVKESIRGKRRESMVKARAALVVKGRADGGDDTDRFSKPGDLIAEMHDIVAKMQSHVEMMAKQADSIVQAIGQMQGTQQENGSNEAARQIHPVEIRADRGGDPVHQAAESAADQELPVEQSPEERLPRVMKHKRLETKRSWKFWR